MQIVEQPCTGPLLLLGIGLLLYALRAAFALVDIDFFGAFTFSIFVEALHQKLPVQVVTNFNANP